MKANARELQRVSEWLVSGDTGLSSMSLCAVFLGLPAKRWEDISWPLDPSDLGRCIRFLGCVDSDKQQGLLRIIAGYRKEWRAIADNWAELTALYEQEYPSGTAPKLYKMMKQLGL